MNIPDHLQRNSAVFQSLFALAQTEEERLWRPAPEKWSMLEIVCHLRDEEVEDFRQRVKTTLESPNSFPPPIHPDKWVKERDYQSEDYDSAVAEWIKQRQESIDYLRQLENPN